MIAFFCGIFFYESQNCTLHGTEGVLVYCFMKLAMMHVVFSTFFSDSINLNIRIKSNLRMNHAAAICPKPADRICAQDLISTLFGNHAQCKFDLHPTLTSFPLIVCVAYLLLHLKVCDGTCTS